MKKIKVISREPFANSKDMFWFHVEIGNLRCRLPVRKHDDVWRVGFNGDDYWKRYQRTQKEFGWTRTSFDDMQKFNQQIRQEILNRGFEQKFHGQARYPYFPCDVDGNGNLVPTEKHLPKEEVPKIEKEIRSILRTFNGRGKRGESQSERAIRLTPRIEKLEEVVDSMSGREKMLFRQMKAWVLERKIAY